MKRWFNRLQCLGKRHPFLPHCLNQALSNTRRQAQHLFHCFGLNQKTGESRTGSKIVTFFKELDFNWQPISCHTVNSILRKAFEVKIMYSSR